VARGGGDPKSCFVDRGDKLVAGGPLKMILERGKEKAAGVRKADFQGIRGVDRGKRAEDGQRGGGLNCLILLSGERNDGPRASTDR